MNILSTEEPNKSVVDYIPLGQLNGQRASNASLTKNEEVASASLVTA